MSAQAYAISEGQKFEGDTNLTVVTCNQCHITYAIPTSLHKAAQKWHGDRPNGWKIFCPLGHQWWFIGETKTEKLERQLQSERDRAGSLAHRLDQTEARRVAQKAATTRAQRERDKVIARIKNGVCPCCNRSFKNVRRHIASQHPEFDVPSEE